MGEICAAWNEHDYYKECKEKRERLALKRHNTDNEEKLEKDGILVGDWTFPP